MSISTNPARMPTVGQHVIHIDELGEEHDALVTNVFSQTCVNLAFVSGDEARSDSYGRQIERKSSHGRLVKERQVRGNSWRFADETEAPTTAQAMGYQTA